LGCSGDQGELVNPVRTAQVGEAKGKLSRQHGLLVRG
jgi:hypothetical protein